jgi:thiamine biosynthesis lipoprotein ApbE
MNGFNPEYMKMLDSLGQNPNLAQNYRSAIEYAVKYMREQNTRVDNLLILNNEQAQRSANLFAVIKAAIRMAEDGQTDFDLTIEFLKDQIIHYEGN